MSEAFIPISIFSAVFGLLGWLVRQTFTSQRKQIEDLQKLLRDPNTGVIRKVEAVSEKVNVVVASDNPRLLMEIVDLRRQLTEEIEKRESTADHIRILAQMIKRHEKLHEWSKAIIKAHNTRLVMLGKLIDQLKK